MLLWVGDQLREALLQIPLWMARGAFLALLFGLMIWVVQIPKSAATPKAASPWHEDLRVWAWLALVIQMFAYALL